MLLLVACGDSQPLPDIDATVEARVEVANASLVAPTAPPLPTYTPAPAPAPEVVVKEVPPTATPTATPTPTSWEKKVDQIMSEWVPMTVEANRITFEAPDDSGWPEGTILDYILYKIQNPNEEVGFIASYLVGVDESGYKLSNDVTDAIDLANGYHVQMRAHVPPKSEAILYWEFRYFDEHDPPYVWEVALEESNSGWERSAGKLDELYSDGFMDFLPMKPSAYNIHMIQVDNGVISGGVPWILSSGLLVVEAEVIDVDPSNNEYFTIDGIYLSNKTDSTIVAEYACDVTESYPDLLPKFPDIENIRYGVVRTFEVGPKTKIDSKDFKASLGPVVEDNWGTEVITRCHSWRMLLRD